MGGLRLKYDFDTVVDRKNTGSLKWDVRENELPMWVADMDFKTAPAITEAIIERAQHGIYGYSIVPDEWGQSYKEWWKNRHNWDIDTDWLVFTTGVIPAISSVVRKLTTPNENVLTQTPVYNIFFNSIVNNGRRVLESPLIYKDGEYSINWTDLESKLSDPQTSLMILCNPQNPSGKIWDRETLQRIGELCKKYYVTVVSDEIHCDITDPNKEYIPFASVSDICRDISITCIAPTKTFNMAGIQTAAVVVPQKNLRHKVWRALNTDEVAEPNTFAISAAIAAYKNGAEWLDELRQYISNNKQIVYDYVKANIPDINVVKSDATYLLWIDCSKLTKDSRRLAADIRKKTGLYLSAGSVYGKGGERFLRLNIACPESVLKDGLERLKNGLMEVNEGSRLRYEMFEYMLEE